MKISRYKQLVAEALEEIPEITGNELRNKLSAEPGYYLIDVRETHELEKGYIPNASHLSRGILEPNIERLIPDHNAEIILYCGGGGRSALAALSLKKMGYKKVSSLAGGFGLWAQQGFPVVS